jgi:hypothetical protein
LNLKRLEIGLKMDLKKKEKTNKPNLRPNPPSLPAAHQIRPAI